MRDSRIVGLSLVSGLMGMFMHLPLAAQESVATATATASPPKAVLGEPIIVQLRLQWNQPAVLPMLPAANDPSLWTDVKQPDGTTQTWQNGNVPPPLPRLAAYHAVSGCPVSIDAVVPLCSPGLYSVRLRYTVSPEWNGYQAFWKGEAASNWVEIEITEPSGEDADVWKTFHAIAPKGDCHQFYDWIISDPTKILSRYPASTYVGYVLLGRGPGLTMWDVARYTREQREDMTSMTEGKTFDERLAKGRKSYEDFVSLAEAFLAAHPGFAKRDLLKKELANALFLLDRPQQALIYIREIAIKEGPLADEAKKTLEMCGENAAGSTAPK